MNSRHHRIKNSSQMLHHMSEPNTNLQDKVNSCFDGSVASTERVSLRTFGACLTLNFRPKTEVIVSWLHTVPLQTTPRKTLNSRLLPKFQVQNTTNTFTSQSFWTPDLIKTTHIQIYACHLIFQLSVQNVSSICRTAKLNFTISCS